ncbi:MAG: YcbK family protein [bacterium]
MFKGLYHNNKIISQSFAVVALILLLMATYLPAIEATELPSSRYFYSGDGIIKLVNAKNGASFNGKYREMDGSYKKEALEGIHRVFNAEYGKSISAISPRLIEFLDFLGDQLRPEAKITIISGWRSPEYNTKLRKKGRLAAKASLHQYGMAADIKIDGVLSERVWNYVKGLKFGGAGYYHSEFVHVDVGPARSWDEKTSGVGTGISEDNKLIRLVTDRDIYLPGERMTLRFIRMTAFPIGVSPEFVLEVVEKEGSPKKIAAFKPSFRVEAGSDCPQFNDISEMMGISFMLPEDLPSGQYQVRASFCDKQWEKMPQDIAAPEFEIFKP